MRSILEAEKRTLALEKLSCGRSAFCYEIKCENRFELPDGGKVERIKITMRSGGPSPIEPSKFGSQKEINIRYFGRISPYILDTNVCLGAHDFGEVDFAVWSRRDRRKKGGLAVETSFSPTFAERAGLAADLPGLSKKLKLMDATLRYLSQKELVPSTPEDEPQHSR